jgi:hypothetical protein
VIFTVRGKTGEGLPGITREIECNEIDFFKYEKKDHLRLDAKLNICKNGIFGYPSQDGQLPTATTQNL